MARDKNNISRSIAGLKIASRFGFKPHNLGLCGPKRAQKEKILEKFLKGEISAAKVRPVLQKFMGAYPYYKLIAKSNGIDDCFNKDVVSAYWIGNELLNNVKTDDLRKMIISEFSDFNLLPLKTAILKAAMVPEKSKPHHSLHVLVIGSVTGSIDFKNTGLKDLCRVSWGKVKSLKNGKCLVDYRPLVGENKIKFGKNTKKEVFWDKNMAPNIKIGDWIFLHWNYVCDKILPGQKKNLIYWTNYHLRLANQMKQERF